MIAKIKLPIFYKTVAFTPKTKCYREWYILEFAKRFTVPSLNTRRQDTSVKHLPPTAKVYYDIIPSSKQKLG